MAFRLRTIDPSAQFSQELTLTALARQVPPALVLAVLAAQDCATPRTRKLTLAATLYRVRCLHLFPRASVQHVFARLARGLRFVWPDDQLPLPGDSALCYRRYQLGARPLAALFHALRRPVATPTTRGAWLWGLRAVALDGTLEAVPDTAANRCAFGGPSNAQGVCAFPQVHAVYLIECGTHVIFDAGFWSYATCERRGAWRFLRSLTPGMLLMWDRGFHEFAFFVAVRAQGVQILSRLPTHIHPERLRQLADGSWLCYLYPPHAGGDPTGRELVRVIEYTFEDSALGGHGEIHRVLTTLLDPTIAPAHAVAVAYHERWEIEIAIDEIDTHQRLATRTLRSLEPVGIIQELYGLLIAYNAVRGLMHEAALTADLDPDRLSFVGAIEVITGAVAEFAMAAPEEHARLYRRLLADVAAERLPSRRARVNPRVVKRKMTKFPVKKPEDRQRRQPWRPIAESLVLI